MATYTCGDAKTYGTIQLGIDAIPGNLLGHGQEWVQAWPKAAGYAETLDFYSGFSNASAADYIDCEAMVSNGGLRGQGIVLDCGSAAVLNKINFGVGGGNNPYCRFHGFCITASSYVAAAANLVISNFSDYTSIYDNIIYDVQSDIGQLIVGIYIYDGKGVLINNNQVFNVGNVSGNGYGIYGHFATGVAASENKVINNIVYNSSTNGIFGSNKAYWYLHNNYSNSGACFAGWGGANNIITYNISSDATADDWGGAGNLISKAAANQFVSVVAGYEDLHPKMLS